MAASSQPAGGEEAPWKVWTTRDGRRLDSPEKLVAHFAELDEIRNDSERLAALRAEVDAEAAGRSRLRRRR